MNQKNKLRRWRRCKTTETQIFFPESIVLSNENPELVYKFTVDKERFFETGELKILKAYVLM